MVPQNVELEARSHSNGNYEKPKGAGRRRDIALKIRRTLAGGAGRDWTHSPCSAESEDSGRSPHCRQPLPKVFHKTLVFSVNFGMSLLHAKFAKPTRSDFKKDPFWKPKSTKNEQKGSLGRNIKNTIKNLTKTMQKRTPNTSQTKHFA